MIKGKSLFLLALFLLSALTQSYAAPSPTGTNMLKAPIAYTIVTPGKQLADGYVQAAQVNHIYRLPQSEYLQNVIHIKTKQFTPLASGSKGFYSSALQRSLSGIGIEQIRAPFADFSSQHLQSADEFGVSRICEVYYSAPVDPYDLCRELMQNPEIEYATPVFVRRTMDYTPNDSLLAQQYHLVRMNAKGAWDVSKGDKNIKIAIIDTGTDWNHIDLAANIWTNPNEIPDDGIDNDGNGKIDDIRGWDFVGNISAAEAQSGAYREDNDPRNNNQSHGTHTAGCASAVTDNRHGIASLGFSCSIIPIKCASDVSGVGGVFRGYEAILYAARLGAEIINCSWGGPGFSPSENDVINQATALGSLVVAAAGNDRNSIDYGNYFPAGHSKVLSVGSSNSSDQPSTSFSNYGNRVRVYAPGENILSTLPNNRYAAQSGTSMSSPVVAGLAGLVLSTFKDYTPMQVIAQIRSSSDNVLVSSNPSARPYYYGRANAAKALQYNNPNYPNLKVPGVIGTDLAFSSGGALTNYEPVDIKLKITNLISTIDNLNIKLSPISDFIEISDGDLSLGAFAEMQSKDMEISVRLLANNPWYSGYAEIMLTYQSTGYEDYQILQIPIMIQSQNVYDRKIYFPAEYGIYWHGISVPELGTAWAAGQVGSTQSPQAGIYYRFANGSTYNTVSTGEALYCIYGFNAQKAIAGTGPSSGNARLFTTTNGGSNWTPQQVNTITNFCNAIHFFSESDGILLGDPIGTAWGVGKTSDGGATWNKITGLTPPQTNETGYVNSVSYLDDKVWFGTSAGRVFRSADQGATWQSSSVFAGGKVMFLAFSDSENGICVYTETQATDARYMCASTIDGGATWTIGVFNFYQAGIIPVNLYAVAGSRMIVAQMSAGQVYGTEDLGASWKPILSYMQPSVYVAEGIANGDKVRLWSAGLNIGHLDFEFIPTEINREIKLATAESLDYGELQVNNGKNDRVTIENVGNVTINLSKVEIIPDEGVTEDEFKIMFGMQTSLGVGKSTTATIRFRPAQTGLRTARLRVVSDAEPSEIIVNLRGVGIEVNSVNEHSDAFSEMFDVSPNPSFGSAKAFINLNFGAEVEIVAFSADGTLARRIYGGSVIGGKSTIELDLSGLSSGAYYLQLNVAGEPLAVKKIVLTK